MNDPRPPASADFGPPEKSPLRMTFGIILQFVLVPLVIVGILVAFFVLGGVLLGGGDRPEDYINKVRTRSGREAWQAAYELSVLLARDEKARENPELTDKIIRAFRDSGGKAPEIRRYLVLAMGQMKSPDAGPALMEALEDSDPETRGYAVWALGASGTTEAVPRLLPLLSDSDPGLRKVTAYALGHLKAASATPELEALLNDPHQDVQWNAALALAQIGGRAGLPLLHRMMDRSYLASIGDLSDGQRQEAMVNAIRAVGLLRDLGQLVAVQGALELLGAWSSPQ